MKRTIQKQPLILKDNMSIEDLTQLINHQLPLSISNMEHIVESIQEKYPLLDKTKVALIILQTFKTMRNLVISGNRVSIAKFCYDMYLKVLIAHPKRTDPGVRVNLVVYTPGILKAQDDI